MKRDAPRLRSEEGSERDQKRRDQMQTDKGRRSPVNQAQRYCWTAGGGGKEGRGCHGNTWQEASKAQ